MKCCKLNFKTYFLSKHKIAIQTKFNRALDRIFSEIEIDIFASSYAVQASYLSVAKLCSQLGVPS